MRSLLFSIPLALRKHAASDRNRRALMHTGLWAALCLALPMTTAYAQEVSPDATGTVTCVELDYNFFLWAEKTYAVELFGNDVVGRWGPGKDMAYSFGAPDPFDELPTEFTVFFNASLQDPPVYESSYSETGVWTFKINYNRGSYTIRGRSFTNSDFPWGTEGNYEWMYLGADCTWKLTGTIPAP